MTTKRKRVRLIPIAVGLALLAAACGGDDDGGGGAASQPAVTASEPEDTTSDSASGSEDPADVTVADEPTEDTSNQSADLEEIIVMIEGGAVPYYAPLYVAEQKGYFADEGLDVNFVYSAGADVITNVAAGNVDFGFPNGDPIITAVASGLPIRVVHTTYQHGIGATLFKSDSGIATPADFAGKKVAVTDFGSPNYIQLQVMLESVGLTLDDVEVEIVGGGAIVDALVSDQVDAIVFSRLRYYNLIEDGVDVQQLLSDDYLPSHGNVVVASEETTQNRPELVGAFNRALNKGLQFVIDGGAAEAVELSVENYSPTFAGREEITTKILEEVYAGYLWPSESGLGSADLAAWQRTADILLEFGLIEDPVDVSTFVLQPSDFE